MSQPPQNSSFIGDIYRGAVHGDFAERLGPVGYVTQAAFGFVPVIGTVCAMRDFVACRRKKDGFGAMLNLLAFIPLFGLFPKTVHVVRSAGSMSQAAIAAKNARDTLTTASR